MTLTPRMRSAAAPPRLSTSDAELSWRLVRADGRPHATVEFEESVVAFFLDSASLLGIPKSVAAIYGVCFASSTPLSFADIAERLDISKGSISQGLRVLREVGALRVVESETSEQRKVAENRDYYEPDLKLRKLAARWIEQRLQVQLDSGKGRLAAMGKKLPKAGAASKILKQRLDLLNAWHDQVRRVMPVIKTFLKL